MGDFAGFPQVTRGIWPFILAQLTVLLLLTLLPQLVMMPARWLAG